MNIIKYNKNDENDNGGMNAYYIWLQWRAHIAAGL